MEVEQGEVCDVDLRAREGEPPPMPIQEITPGLYEEPPKATMTPIMNIIGTQIEEVRPLEIKSEKVIKYLFKECLRNHDASIGGHAIDGCGEFMAGGEEGSPRLLDVLHVTVTGTSTEEKWRESISTENASKTTMPAQEATPLMGAGNSWPEVQRGRQTP
jgi:ZF-HD homeobox protein with Cys/His-rich dimerization domain